MKLKEKWVAHEEILPGFTPATTIDFQQVGGLAPGSIPFGDADGFLIQDNANLFWDEPNARLGLNQIVPTARIDIVAEATFPGINISAGAFGEMSTPDGESFRWGHWNEVDTFTERLKFDAAGIFYVSYLTTASVLFAGANGEIKQDNANLRWDNASKRFGVGKAPSNVLDVEGAGTSVGGGVALEVIGRFHNETATKHTAIAIDALGGYDPILYLSETGSSIWGIRNDASATDEFQIRYQAGGANRIDFKIDNVGNVEITTGTFDCVGPLTINQNADTLVLSHDGTSAYFTSSTRFYTFLTDEGVNTHTNIYVKGKGMGKGQIYLFDEDDNEYLRIAGGGQAGWITTDGAAPGGLNLQNATATDIICWAAIGAGNPYFYIYGFGAAAVEWLRFRVEADNDALIEAEHDLNILAGGGSISFGDENLSTSGNFSLKSNAELRFYDNGNYVGFEAPDLDADQIWVLPATDGNVGDVIITDGAGNLSFSPAGAGDVTAAANITDHALVRGNGGVKGIQDTGILVADDDTLTLPDGARLVLREAVAFNGGHAENLITFPDARADALSFKEAGNTYLTFKTTNAAEAVIFGKVFTGVSGSTIGNLTLADGSITDSGGAISFGDENLSTTGNLVTGNNISIGGAVLSNVALNIAGSISSIDNALGMYMGQLTLTPTTGWAAFFGYFGGTVAVAAGDTVVSAYGNYVAAIAKNGTGTITNTYGLFLGTQIVGTTNWGIYQEGADNKNYFAGNIGIGQSTFGTNATKTIAQGTGVAPTTSPADCFQMYSADIGAGHAAMHIRNENDTIIKLYQQALVADPAGQANDLDSEARTAIDSILDILENNGLMANA